MDSPWYEGMRDRHLLSPAPTDASGSLLRQGVCVCVCLVVLSPCKLDAR